MNDHYHKLELKLNGLLVDIKTRLKSTISQVAADVKDSLSPHTKKLSELEKRINILESKSIQ